MGATWGPNRLLYRAVVISLALHLVIALFIPAMATFQGDGPSIETISFVRTIRISVLPAQRVAHEPPAAAPVHAPVPAVVVPPRKANFSHVRSKAIVHGRVSAAPVAGPEPRKGGARAQIESSAPPAAVTATPAAAAVSSSETQNQTGGYMPLGAEEPTPVLDPSVHSSLAKLGAHTTLTIDVDESGKTKSVRFSPDLDAALEAQIRSMLASAHWDAAICGAGVACEATATIKL